LTSKDVRKIVEMMHGRFGFSGELDYAFFLNNKDKVYIISRDLAKVDTSKLRINVAGLYFADISDNSVRLSIEGSQIIGPKCTKNTITLDEKQAQEWLRGVDVDIDYADKGFVLMKYEDDFVGSGKAVEKKILNYVPKNRRLK